MLGTDSNAVSGPAPGAIMTPEYVRAVGRFAYLWGWPLVNLHNRRSAMARVPRAGLSGGVVPVAPLNRLSMLSDYVSPEQRYVACPNQDVVYGFGCLALDVDPVVIQVPDFGDRFWVWQLVDQRTDAFGKLGKMYGTRPGFYMIVGPDWTGEPPAGISAVFRSPTNTAITAPRVFLNDTAQDRAAIRPVISGIAAYPLGDFDGTMKRTDWSKLPSFPDPNAGASGASEVKWVLPEVFFTVLAAVLEEVVPLSGEEALYEQLRAVLAAAAADRSLMKVLNQTAVETEEELIGPLREFRNFGIPLPGGWTTQNNGAEFGVDYLTRTAVAKSNILVNRPIETKYFYLDTDGAAQRLTGTNRYTVTFEKGQLPPVEGFWSLSLYNEEHFFVPNKLNRYSLGTKNDTLRYGADGSLTLYVQHDEPSGEKAPNWLPAPSGPFSLFVRAYGPEASILDGRWTPPSAVQV